MDRNRTQKKFILVYDAVIFEISGNGRIMEEKLDNYLEKKLDSYFISNYISVKLRLKCRK